MIHFLLTPLLCVYMSLPPSTTLPDPPTNTTPPGETPFIFCLLPPTAFWDESFHILLEMLHGLHPSTRTEALLQGLNPSYMDRVPPTGTEFTLQGPRASCKD